MLGVIFFWTILERGGSRDVTCAKAKRCVALESDTVRSIDSIKKIQEKTTLEWGEKRTSILMNFPIYKKQLSWRSSCLTLTTLSGKCLFLKWWYSQTRRNALPDLPCWRFPMKPLRKPSCWVMIGRRLVCQAARMTLKVAVLSVSAFKPRCMLHKI